MKAFAPLVAALVSWLVCRLLVRARGRLLDRPNERSLHETPVPRGGGLGILLGLASAWILLPEQPGPVAWAVVLGLAMGVFSLLDDLYHLSPLVRFAVQGVLAALLVAQGLWPVHLPLPGVGWAWPSVVGAGFAWLLLVWMTNLYNFMDGMDGFAGGMTVIGFGALALLGWQAGDPGYALLCGSIAAGAAGFLWFNFPPARLFMGDVGSTAIGFLATGLMLWADRQAIFPLWVGLLVFSPFIVDATVTLLRRLASGERVWEAHRSHYYQRLVRVGWGHRKTVMWEYVLMVLCAAAAIVAISLPPIFQLALLIAWLVVYGIIATLVRRLERPAN